jgi:hypothetical protein
MTNHTLPPVLAVVHVFYLDVWERMAPGLTGIPLLITCPVGKGIPEVIRLTRPDAQFFECQNRGRDWLPFLEALRAHPVAPETVIIKLHTKRSPYLKDGEEWLNRLVNSLASSPAQIEFLRQRFAADPEIGVLVPNGHMLRIELYIEANRPWLERLTGECDLNDWMFPAGSMFAARRSALDSLFALDLAADRFAPEPLAIDGHLPHAIERLVGWSAHRSGFRLDLVEEFSAQTNQVKIDPRHEDWHGEFLRRNDMDTALNFLVCPSGTSWLGIVRTIFALKQSVQVHHIFLPPLFHPFLAILKVAFRHSIFHSCEDPGLQQVKQFLQRQVAEPPRPVVVFAPTCNWVKQAPSLLTFLNKPFGYEVWFARAQYQDATEDWPAIRSYVIDDLKMRWDLESVRVPGTGEIALSTRMSRVWAESPMMPTEREEQMLLGVLAKFYGPGEPKRLETLETFYN